MSRVQPPGRPVPFATPGGCANASEGFGHVVAVAGMNLSIVKNVFVNALAMLCAESVHVALSGGDVRLTSFCNRQEYAAPAWSTCVVCAVSALAIPFTPSQPP